MYSATTPTMGARFVVRLCRGRWFWQLRQNRDSKNWAFFLPSDWFPFGRHRGVPWARRPHVSRPQPVPPHTPCFRGGSRGGFRPHFGAARSQSITPAPSSALRSLRDTGSAAHGPPTPWGRRICGDGRALRPASPSPHCPQDPPLVSGPRAGDKVALENQLGTYKRKRKHTKCISFFQNRRSQSSVLAEPEKCFRGG